MVRVSAQLPCTVDSECTPMCDVIIHAKKYREGDCTTLSPFRTEAINTRERFMLRLASASNKN